jgi:2''-5'' RNA ligase
MRLFIGIDLPDEQKQTLLEFQSELRHHGVNGLWKSEENFHITLEFLGELESNTLSIITEILSKGAENHKRFNLNLGGLGAFPSFIRPHTLWTGVGGSLNELQQLRNEIHTELAKKGFLLEDRGFRPHITLASRPKLNDIDLSVFQTKKLGEFNVGEVVLFESRAIRGKRTYTNLYGASLSSQM